MVGLKENRDKVSERRFFHCSIHAELPACAEPDSNRRPMASNVVFPAFAGGVDADKGLRDLPSLSARVGFEPTYTRCSLTGIQRQIGIATRVRRMFGHGSTTELPCVCKSRIRTGDKCNPSWHSRNVISCCFDVSVKGLRFDFFDPVVFIVTSVCEGSNEIKYLVTKTCDV